MVRGEDNVVTAVKNINRLVNIMRPRFGVAHLRAAQRVQIVHVVGAVFGHAQSAISGEEEVHLGRGFRAGRHLKLDLKAVYNHRLSGVGNVVGWLDQRHETVWRCLP